MSEPATLIIGVGNAMRGDDGAGPAVAERLTGVPGLEIRILSGEGAGLIEAWRDRPRVVVVDAAAGTGTPGDLHTFDPHSEPVPRGTFHYSSHAFGLAEAVEMSRALDCLPAAMTIYAIVGAKFDHGPGLSPQVAATVERLADTLRP